MTELIDRIASTQIEGLHDYLTEEILHHWYIVREKTRVSMIPAQ